METLKEKVTELLQEDPHGEYWWKILDLILPLKGSELASMVEFTADSPEYPNWPPRHRSCGPKLWQAVERMETPPVWWKLIGHVDYFSNDAEMHKVDFLKTIESLHLMERGFVLITEIEVLTQLRFLKLEEYNIRLSLEPIAPLVNLEELEIGAIGIENLEDLKGLSKLNYLDLSNCEDLKDISAISSLQNLGEVAFEGSPNLEDLSPLLDLPKLKYVHVEDCDAVSNLDLLEDAAHIEVNP